MSEYLIIEKNNNNSEIETIINFFHVFDDQ